MSAVPVTTRTGRRVVPTPAAAAAAAAAAASPSTPGGNKPGPKSTKVVKMEEKANPPAVAKDPAPSLPPAVEEEAAGGSEPQKKRGVRTARVSSSSADESTEKSGGSSPPAKKIKITTPVPEAEVEEELKVEEEKPSEETPALDTSAGSAVEMALSKMFEEAAAAEKEEELQDTLPAQSIQILEVEPSAESVQISEAQTQGMEVDLEVDTQVVENIESKVLSENIQLVAVINESGNIDVQQQSAVESILSDDIGEGVPEPEHQEVEMLDEEDKTVKVETFPSWNEQGCIICNVDIALEEPTPLSKSNHEKIKEFFLEFFSVGDQISLEGENAFPFCQKCAEDMESLLGINHKIEFMHKQFNKVRDSLAKKAVKTFLVRTKPNCLEEDAKTESYGFLDDEQKKSYKEQMYNLWKSRYELVQPGPKTPIMIRSMDSRGRVTVVRLNSQGQPIPEKFGNMKRFSGTDVPMGGMGRTVTNGEEDVDGSDGGNGLDIYKCKECPKSFSAKAMLAYHSRIHSGELPFECDLCGKAFSVPHYLMTHMRSHTGEKPFKCNECGKGFAQRGGLVTHALVHTGAKPYSCQVCGKSFRQKYHLTQHNLIHSGVKPFSCDLCGKCFNVKMNLREHMRRHTGDRPYKCPYCTSIGFFRKKMLKDHIVKAHPQRPMPLELMSADLDLAMGMSNDSSHSDDLEGGEVDSILPDDDHLENEDAAVMAQ